MDDADFERVAYYDPAYQTAWVHDPTGIARLLAQRHGFIILDAKRLAAWMKAASVRDPSRTVAVLLQGFVPDTIAEKKSASCTARRYLDAGGRLVSIGDVPFFQVGDARRGRKEWGDAGHVAVLEVDHCWGSSGETIVTPEGRAWGLELSDVGERCSNPSHVTPLRLVKFQNNPNPLAATWHKAYHPRHPFQGFLRYRGGSFDHVHWNAKVNELARLALRGFEEPFRAPGSWRDDALAGKARAVFADPRYPACWSTDPQASAARLASAHGFSPLAAEELRGWMRAQVAAGAAGSVCVLLHGIAPDTVYDDASPHCLARRYLDAGGRLVWAGDVPFLMRGRADGRHDGNKDSGTSEAVLDIPVRWDWEMPGPPFLTEAGKAWGLKTFTDEALRCADASCVTEVLAGVGPFASTWLKTYARDVPGSGFLRFRGGAFHPGLADELAALAVHNLPLRASSAAAAPEPAPDGERTGGGSFVVDRGRALEKLMKFMLPSPELFLLPLARVAAASGARRFSLTKSGRDLVVEFDGLPLPAAAVHDPFAAVTAESPDPRLRAWGLAVLTALRAAPKEVFVSSAGEAGDAAAVVRSPSEVVRAPKGVSGGTYFRIVAPKARMPPLDRLRAALAARAPRFAAELSDRRAAGRPAPAELAFDDGPVHGRLSVPDAHRVSSNLLVCVQGVGAATVSFVLYGAAQVDGWVNDDRLGLNASLNGVVRDERLDALAAVLREKLQRLLRVAAAKSGDLAAGRAARLGRAGMPALWDRHLHAFHAGRLGAAWGALARVAVPDADEEALVEEARLVRWLRESAAGLLSSLERDAGDPVRAALWRAPLFTAVDGSPLSLETLELARRVDGRVPFAYELGPAPADGRPTAWAPEKRDQDALRRFFPDQDVALAARRRSGAKGGGLLERAGLQDFLVRVPIEGGEAGLRFRPDGRAGLRVHGLKGGRPASFHHQDGRLRVDAVVEGQADAKAASAAEAAADRLYRLLASSFSCPLTLGFKGEVLRAWSHFRGDAPLEREAAALSHMRDYLAACVASKGPAWPRGLPLYESALGWLSHDALAAALERDGLVLWADRGVESQVLRLGLDAGYGRDVGDKEMRALFPGLERHALGRLNAVAWLKAPPRLSCSHQAPFGCLAQGKVDGAEAHLAVSEKGEVLLYPLPAGEPRTVTAAAAGALAYEAAVTAALRAPRTLSPGTHPWRDFVLRVAERELGPWPGRPGAAPLRVLLAANLLFQGRWGGESLLGLGDALRGEHPLPYTSPGGAFDPARYVFSETELSFLKALWPKGADRLMTAEEYARYNKALTLDSKVSEGMYARARAAARPAAVPSAEGTRAADLPALMREVGAACGSWSASAEFFLEPRRGKALVTDGGGRRYVVFAGHPRAKAVLDAGLSPEAALPYLASLAHTAVNRLKPAVTDKDDVEFQAAVAAWAADG